MEVKIMDHIEFSRLLAEDWIDEERKLSVEKKILTHDFYHHWHDFFEIELVLNGHGKQILNGIEYPLQMGSVYLLRPTDFHEIKVDNKIEIYNIMFSDECLSDELLYTILTRKDNIIFSAEGSQFRELRLIFELMCAEFTNQNKNFSLNYTRNLLECLLISILRKIFLAPISMTINNPPIQKAIVYLQLHFNENPSLKEIASIVNLSPNYFCELFSKITGQTYIEYLTNLKISYAKKLLLSTNLSITEICLASGFNSLSHFLKSFKSYTGLSPKKYLKTYILR